MMHINEIKKEEGKRREKKTCTQQPTTGQLKKIN
jgi:hypothetical protein